MNTIPPNIRQRFRYAQLPHAGTPLPLWGLARSCGVELFTTHAPGYTPRYIAAYMGEVLTSPATAGRLVTFLRGYRAALETRRGK